MHPDNRESLGETMAAPPNIAQGASDGWCPWTSSRALAVVRTLEPLVSVARRHRALPTRLVPGHSD